MNNERRLLRDVLEMLICNEITIDDAIIEIGHEYGIEIENAYNAGYQAGMDSVNYNDDE